MKKLRSTIFLLTVFTVLAIPISTFAQTLNSPPDDSIRTIPITFTADMKSERINGSFDPASGNVALGGNFNVWQKTPMIRTQSNYDIYKVTFLINVRVGDTITFNFWHSTDTWENVGVRKYCVTEDDYSNEAILLDTIGFNTQPTTVTFKCNMSLQLKNGTFVRGDRVFVRGNFNYWYRTNYELTDEDGDSVYSAIFYSFRKGQELLFMFTNYHGGNDIRENIGNRTLTVKPGTNVFEDYWNGINDNEPAKQIQFTFYVNMDLEKIIDLFNPTTDSVSVRGNFNNWQNLTMIPTQFNQDVYYVTIQLQCVVGDTISYGFFHSPDTHEIVGTRKYIITKHDCDNGAANVITRFNEDPLAPPIAIVVFKCNMTSQMKKGTFVPGDKVFVQGNFNDWTGTDYELTDQNGDSIYIGVFSDFTSWQQLIFNFTNNHEGKVVVESIGKRVLTVQPGINIYETRWEEVSEVIFKCNMSVQMKKGTFSIGDKVFVRGDFNGWGGTDYELKDADGDSIYSSTFNTFSTGQSLVFKYTNNHAGNDVWESTGNRELTVASGVNIYTACWEDICIYKPTKTIQVTFSVNMKTEKKSPTFFNPLVDSVSVRGSFNGWGETRMTPLVDSADIYRVVVPIEAMFDEKISFKFFYSPGTWEVNNLTDKTQNNRYFIVNQAVFDSASFSYATYFNNDTLRLPDLLQPSYITFTCNTNGSSIANAPVGTEFKTIHMAGGTPPTQWPNSGWPDSDINKVIQLYDDGTHEDKIAGDKIFTCELQFPQYNKYSLQYRYAANWGLPTNGGSNNNEMVSGLNKTLVWNYMTATALVIDTFGIIHTTDVTKVEKLGNTTPTNFKLEQNFPNPFNPETKISWQLAVGSFVTLKVFDVLGNEVATLVNEEQPAGTYQVSFNTLPTTNQQQLTSGIYFYQLRAGNFVQTKKMILLR